MKISKLADAIINLKEDEALRIIHHRLEIGDDAMSLVEECRRSISIVGERFQRKEYFLGELIMSGEIFKGVMAILEPKLRGNIENKKIGQIVLGTVKGDIHDIGKNIVATLLRINGFEVFDLGVDVEPKAFIEKVAETGTNIVGMSGLLTPAFESMKNTVKAIEESGIRDQVKIIIGGGIVIKQVQDYVRADAFVRDAAEGVDICKGFLR